MTFHELRAVYDRLSARKARIEQRRDALKAELDALARDGKDTHDLLQALSYALDTLAVLAKLPENALD